MKRSQALWSLVLLSGLLAAFMTSWTLHRYVDYGYSFWYDQLSIEEHIDKYGPRNRYIKGFQTLDRDEHIVLFSGIVDAVHKQGQGLGELSFTDTLGREKRLLREPEIVHLQDVAHLVDVLSIAGGVALLVSALGVWFLQRRRIAVQWKSQGILFASLLGLIGLIVLIVGPKDVFYQLHVWIFPDDHQWFFYYQDSLMSTMMKAPDLFGGIGATLVGLGLFLFAGFVAWLVRMTRNGKAALTN